ncbi:Ribonucleoside-diphosphate reductase small chain A [Linum grandiflorum]
MENVHSSKNSPNYLMDTYIKDPSEKHRLFNAIENIPCVARKAKWALSLIHGT